MRIREQRDLKQNLEARRGAANVFSGRLSGVLRGFTVAEMTQRQMATQLNVLGIGAACGGAWSLAQLQRVLKRQQVACRH